MTTIVTSNGHEISVPYDEFEHVTAQIARFGGTVSEVWGDEKDRPVIYGHVAHVTEVVNGEVVHKKYPFTSRGEAELTVSQFERLNAGRPRGEEGMWDAWVQAPTTSSMP